jgi:hypothetical protein
MPSLRLRLAVVTSVFCSLATALYVGADVEPLPIVGWWLAAAPGIMTIVWLCQDAQRRRIGVVTDLGFFLLFLWPVALPWYAFKSRGPVRGFLLLLGLLALICATPLTALLFALLRGRGL